MSEPCLYFFFDDYIVYPEEYFDQLEVALRRYRYRAIFGVHGLIYKYLITSYIKDRTMIHFSRDLSVDVLVDELGTGTIAFHSHCIRIDRKKWTHTNMNDLNLMIEAVRQQVPRICIRRKQNLIQAIAEGQADSLFRKSLADDSTQTELLQAAMSELPDNWCMSS